MPAPPQFFGRRMAAGSVLLRGPFLAFILFGLLSDATLPQSNELLVRGFAHHWITAPGGWTERGSKPESGLAAKARDVRHSELIANLSEQGWCVASREREELDWWADEIWLVKSEWPPRGFTVFLTWLVDPQCDDHRQPGQGVWAVGTCLEHPVERSRFSVQGILACRQW